MKMVVKILLGVICTIGMVFNVHAQRQKNVSDEYTYVMSDNESLKEARLKAIQRAKVKILADNFGTLIEQTNITVMKGGKSEFRSLGMSDVRGEWLGDTKAPEFIRDVIGEDGLRYITVKVCGTIREINAAEIDIKACLLKNGMDKRLEDNEFKTGDQYYLTFHSPVNGYLAVYLMGEDGVSSRILPYNRVPEMSYYVEANKDYMFFAPKKINEGDDINFVDEYIMYTDKEIEYNRMYIIFSPNEFAHPIDREGGKVNYGKTTYSKPREVNFDSMQNWLIKSRNRDKHMQVIRKEITIRK
ncbi:MAG: DUF4384 domain-containing protein [Muribaculaceae bacterium]|nr:DUF4384 domain-containing protein [Muribaculaceae bacterium]